MNNVYFELKRNTPMKNVFKLFPLITLQPAAVWGIQQTSCMVQPKQTLLSKHFIYPKYMIFFSVCQNLVFEHLCLSAICKTLYIKHEESGNIKNIFVLLNRWRGVN